MVGTGHGVERIRGYHQSAGIKWKERAREREIDRENAMALCSLCPIHGTVTFQGMPSRHFSFQPMCLNVRGKRKSKTD